MVKRSKESPVAEFHMLGDKVLWKGIKLTVTELLPDGSVVATSPTMRVHVSDHEQLEKGHGS
jgi:hypothetical protein